MEDETMTKMQRTFWNATFAVALGLLLAAPILAGTAPRDPNLDGGVILGPITDVPSGPGDNWIDHFDTYVAGSQMHGQGGWKGWANSPAAGAVVTAAQARSAPLGLEIGGDSDLVHEYSGYTTGTWTYTAWMFIPTGFSGQTYFILLNNYTDAICASGQPPCNWSLQIAFDSAVGTVSPQPPGDCATVGGSLPLILDQWVEVRDVIDLDTNVQTIYYGGQQLVQCSWTEGVSGSGMVNISAVDLFANLASTVHWDDISLSNLPFVDGFESGDTNEWHYTAPPAP
jgi:hypothetical protein